MYNTCRGKILLISTRNYRFIAIPASRAQLSKGFVCCKCCKCYKCYKCCL